MGGLGRLLVKQATQEGWNHEPLRIMEDLQQEAENPPAKGQGLDNAEAWSTEVSAEVQPKQAQPSGLLSSPQLFRMSWLRGWPLLIKPTREKKVIWSVIRILLGTSLWNTGCGVGG